MKRLGANVVRIDLQLGKFMNAPGEPNPNSLAQFAKLIGFAEQLGVYLDVMGLGTFRVAERHPVVVPRSR